MQVILGTLRSFSASTTGSPLVQGSKRTTAFMLSRPAIAAILSSALVGSVTAAEAIPAMRASTASALQRNVWYLPTADGAARLYITEIGAGPTVVFLHGGPGNDFQYIVPALQPHLSRHRFILFDARGSLLSPVRPDRRNALTLDNLVADLELLRVASGQERLTLFGHSFGSLLALAYYQAHPDRVDRLVLTGAFPPATSMTSLTAAMRPRQKALRERSDVAATLAREGLAGPVEHLTPRQASQRARIEGLAALSAIDMSRWRQVEGGGVYYNQEVDSAIGASLPPAFDFRPTIRVGDAPITVIQGDQDYIDPGASAWRELAAAEPSLSIRVVVVPAASHNAWIDAPERFGSALSNGLIRRSR